MKAVIIAAGQGSRIKNISNDKPKSLIKLNGLSIIERIILNANKAGIDEFIIITGYKSDILINEIKSFKTLKNIKISFIYNDKYKTLANGYSVYCAKNSIKKDENFFILMSDHLINSNIIKKAIKDIPNQGECKLVIDRDIKNCFDLDDATKVLTKNNNIIAMSKELKDYNALDCGIFFTTYNIFNAIDIALKNGISSLTGANTELIKQKKMKFIEKDKKGFWLDIDTQESFDYAKGIINE